MNRSVGGDSAQFPHSEPPCAEEESRLWAFVEALPDGSDLRRVAKVIVCDGEMGIERVAAAACLTPELVGVCMRELLRLHFGWLRGGIGGRPWRRPPPAGMHVRTMDEFFFSLALPLDDEEIAAIDNAVLPIFPRDEPTPEMAATPSGCSIRLFDGFLAWLVEDRRALTPEPILRGDELWRRPILVVQRSLAVRKLPGLDGHPEIQDARLDLALWAVVNDDEALSGYKLALTMRGRRRQPLEASLKAGATESPFEPVEPGRARVLYLNVDIESDREYLGEELDALPVDLVMRWRP